MSNKGIELISGSTIDLAENQNVRLRPLLNHIAESINVRLSKLSDEGKQVNIYGPEWCFENPEQAGRMHADVIVGAYGSTYALPNKDPEANAEALRAQNLDMYLMEIDGEVTGTTCLVDMGNGTAELGRSASRGRTSNSIIQDLRIFDWLTNPQAAEKYHTLFTTLRTAPDRQIPVEHDEFTMRGGQAVTEHWKKFPGLTVNGFAPLYLKQGKLEQFSHASLTRSEYDQNSTLHIGSNGAWNLVEYWHKQYDIDQPFTRDYGEDDYFQEFRFSVHYPPAESGLTELVHADVELVENDTSDKSLADCLNEAEAAGSPFIQVLLPIDKNTLHAQQQLDINKFRVFGYIPGTSDSSPRLLYGRVKSGTDVVPTAWAHNNQDNPLWNDPVLSEFAKMVENDWTMGLKSHDTIDSI